MNKIRRLLQTAPASAAPSPATPSDNSPCTTPNAISASGSSVATTLPATMIGERRPPRALRLQPIRQRRRRRQLLVILQVPAHKHAIRRRAQRPHPLRIALALHQKRSRIPNASRRNGRSKNPQSRKYLLLSRKRPIRNPSADKHHRHLPPSQPLAKNSARSPSPARSPRSPAAPHPALAARKTPSPAENKSPHRQTSSARAPTPAPSCVVVEIISGRCWIRLLQVASPAARPTKAPRPPTPHESRSAPPPTAAADNLLKPRKRKSQPLPQIRKILSVPQSLQIQRRRTIARQQAIDEIARQSPSASCKTKYTQRGSGPHRPPAHAPDSSANAQGNPERPPGIEGVEMRKVYYNRMRISGSLAARRVHLRDRRSCLRAANPRRYLSAPPPQATLKAASLESHEGLTISALPWTDPVAIQRQIPQEISVRRRSPRRPSRISATTPTKASASISTESASPSSSATKIARKSRRSTLAATRRRRHSSPSRKIPPRARNAPDPHHGRLSRRPRQTLEGSPETSQDAEIPSSVVDAHGTVQGLLYFDLQNQFDLLQSAHLYIPQISLMIRHPLAHLFRHRPKPLRPAVTQHFSCDRRASLQRQATQLRSILRYYLHHHLRLKTFSTANSKDENRRRFAHSLLPVS